MATKHKSDVKSPTYAPLHKAGVSSHNAQLTNCREESATQKKKAAPTVRQEADIQGQNHRNTVIYGIMKTESYLHPKKMYHFNINIALYSTQNHPLTL